MGLETGTYHVAAHTVLFTKLLPPSLCHSEKAAGWNAPPPQKAIPPLTASELEWWNHGIVPGKSWKGREP